MTDCCTSSCNTGVVGGKYRCPVNGREYREVSVKTIMHHIKESWLWQGGDQVYYFCDDPECEVVYFGSDDSVIEKSAIRTSVGVKAHSDDALMCYCFGISKEIADTCPEAKAFVLKETKGHVCECEVRNPSGKCCLKDFPKA